MKKVFLLFFLLSVGGCSDGCGEQPATEDTYIIKKIQQKKPMYYIKKTNCKIVLIRGGVHKRNIICDYAIYDTKE